MEHKAKRIGKFNVIDILAVILIVAAIVLVAWKFLDRDADTPVDLPTTVVTYTVRAEGVAKELYESCKEYLPSPLMASGVLVGGQIESVEMKPYYVLSGDGQWVEDPDHVNLYFTATTEVIVNDVMMTKVGDQEIRVGKSHILKSEYIEMMDTVIVDVRWGE